MDIECEGWNKILKVFPDMDFTQELADKPELSKYMRGALNSKSLGLENPLELSSAPTLDSDFSKFVLLNGLPKVNEEKAEKLKKLIVKLFLKKSNIVITEDKVEIKFDSANPPVSTGQCFVEMKNEEQAKISAAQFNGHKLDSKHFIYSCTVPDFEKILDHSNEPSEEDKQVQIGYLDLVEHCL